MYLNSGSAVRLAEAALERECRESADGLAAVAEHLLADGVDAETVVRVGQPADVILAEADESGAELLVISTHGRGGAGRLLHGSVADEVLRRARLPILTVPPAVATWPSEGPGRVLVALDGSALAEAALTATEPLARPFGAELVLLRVVDPPGRRAFPELERERAHRYLSRLRRRVRADGLAIRTMSRVGSAAATIAAVGRELDVDAIAMGTRGRGGLTRLMLGSTAEATLRRASTPLLLLPAAACAAPLASRAGPPRSPVRA